MGGEKEREMEVEVEVGVVVMRWASGRRLLVVPVFAPSRPGMEASPGRQLQYCNICGRDRQSSATTTTTTTCSRPDRRLSAGGGSLPIASALRGLGMTSISTTQLRQRMSMLGRRQSSRLVRVVCAQPVEPLPLSTLDSMELSWQQPMISLSISTSARSARTKGFCRTKSVIMHVGCATPCPRAYPPNGRE